jgi:hypothetical protein
VAAAPNQRQAIARLGAHISWAHTDDRSARTRPARRNSPASLDYHLARLDPERFANATDSQKLAAAESAKKAYYAGLTMRSIAARRGGRGDAA